MRHKSSSDRKKSVIIAVITALAAIILIQYFYFKFYALPAAKKTAANDATEVLAAQMKSNHVDDVEVYAAGTEVKKGQSFSDANITTISLPKDKIPAGMTTSKADIVGKLARVNIPQYMPLVNSVLVAVGDEISQDLRTHDYDFIKLAYKLKVGDYVDLRILRKDGTDDIVVAKKLVKAIDGNRISFDMNEKELQYFNAAAVEATVKQATIYTSLYVDPENQLPATITYVPDKKITDMISKNPNVIDQALQVLKEKTSEIQKQQQQTSQQQSQTGGLNSDSNTVGDQQNVQNTNNSNDVDTRTRR